MKQEIKVSLLEASPTFRAIIYLIILLIITIIGLNISMMRTAILK